MNISDIPFRARINYFFFVVSKLLVSLGFPTSLLGSKHLELKAQPIIIQLAAQEVAGRSQRV